MGQFAWYDVYAAGSLIAFTSGFNFSFGYSLLEKLVQEQDEINVNKLLTRAALYGLAGGSTVFGLYLFVPRYIRGLWMGN